MSKQNTMYISNKTLGILLFITAILVTWNWGIAMSSNDILWIIINVLYVTFPIFYLINCSCAGDKSSEKNINPFIFSALILIAVATIYQLLSSNIGVVDNVLLNYINGFSILFYSFLAGKIVSRK